MWGAIQYTVQCQQYRIKLHDDKLTQKKRQPDIQPNHSQIKHTMRVLEGTRQVHRGTTSSMHGYNPQRGRCDQCWEGIGGIRRRRKLTSGHTDDKTSVRLTRTRECGQSRRLLAIASPMQCQRRFSEMRQSRTQSRPEPKNCKAMDLKV